MDEKTPSWIFRTLQIVIPLVSVAVAATGVLLTVAARKKELTCTVLSSTRLVSENLGGIHPDLHVEFHGQPIFSLTKMTFDLRNTGAAAIMAKDVIEPVKLAFPSGTRLMSANVEKTYPSDLTFMARALPDVDSVELQFPLMNRSDEAVFSVYLFNTEVQKPVFEGRIVDVPQLVYSEASISAANRSTWPFQSHATRSVVRWVLVCLYGGLAMLFASIWVAGIVSYVQHLPWRRKWQRSYDEAVREFMEASRQARKTQMKTARDKVEGEGGTLVSPENHLMPIAYSVPFHGRSGEFFLGHPGLDEELKKRGIPLHPHPMVESFGGLAGLTAAMLVLALVCLTTGLLVYKALNS